MFSLSVSQGIDPRIAYFILGVVFIHPFNILYIFVYLNTHRSLMCAISVIMLVERTVALLKIGMIMKVHKKFNTNVNCSVLIN